MPSLPLPSRQGDVSPGGIREAGYAVAACPTTPLGDVLFNRWTVPILWILGRHGTQRFDALHRLLPEITPKILTSRLRQLQRDGLIERTYHSDIPSRAEYSLSDLGRSLTPVLESLGAWSREHLPDVDVARRAYDAALAEEEAWAEGRPPGPPRAGTAGPAPCRGCLLRRGRRASPAGRGRPWAGTGSRSH
ncbi:winged helix-turn-helix transcriptional regulator [Kitasatospora aureofaciens]|uniref:winged helix-turn-helix transcriptional regulator n=1 Tax=Kitasatospora aureofaciens TaxID=1894 RepID=UPI0037C597D3